MKDQLGTDPVAEARSKIAHELHEGEKIEHSVTILRPPQEVFEFWRKFSNLPKFMTHLSSVEQISQARTRWKWKTRGGVELEFESEVIAEIPDRMISWQTLPDSSVHHAGSVWFRPAPQDNATEVHVLLMYSVPGGKLAKKLAELFGEDPSQTLRENLRRLKSLLETGEVPTTDGQPHGSSGILH